MGPGIHVSNHPFGSVGSQFVFGAPSPLGVELWVSDGTSSGTVLLKDIAIGARGSFPRHFTPFNGKLLFNAMDSNGFRQVWITDGTTPGTIPLAAFDTNWMAPPVYLSAEAQSLFTQVGLNAYFVAYTDTAGWEVWSTDGTPTGTHMIAELRPGVATGLPQCLTSFDGSLFLIGNTQAVDQSLLRYDPPSDSFFALRSTVGTLPARAKFVVKASDSVLFADCNPQTGIGFEPHAFRASPPLIVATLGRQLNASTVWPNPTRNLLFVRSASLPASITLMNATGLVVLQKQQEAEVETIIMEALPRGIYTLKIHAREAGVEVKKVIVQ